MVSSRAVGRHRRHYRSRSKSFSVVFSDFVIFVANFYNRRLIDGLGSIFWFCSWVSLLFQKNSIVQFFRSDWVLYKFYYLGTQLK
jgi:hypothetical protein